MALHLRFERTTPAYANTAKIIPSLRECFGSQVVEPAPGYACDRVWFDETFQGPGLQPTRTIGDHAARGTGWEADFIYSLQDVRVAALLHILQADGTLCVVVVLVGAKTRQLVEVRRLPGTLAVSV